MVNLSADETDYLLLCQFFVQLEELTERQSFTPTKEACDNMLIVIKRALRQAANYKKLINLAGHWQDGSCGTVKLHWDDATRTAFVNVNKKQFYVEGGNFEAAIGQIPDNDGKGEG